MGRSRRPRRRSAAMAWCAWRTGLPRSSWPSAIRTRAGDRSRCARFSSSIRFETAAHAAHTLRIPTDRAEFELFYREEFGRILASVAHGIRDLQVAEEAVQDAFAVALERWPREGRPRNPRAWL